MINTHIVQDAADMRAYAARLRAIPAVLDEAITQSRASAAIGVHAPKFQVERVIDGSRAIVTGAPFDEGAASPLWAAAQAQVAKLQSTGTVTDEQARPLPAAPRTPLPPIKPPYGRDIGRAPVRETR